MFCFVFFFSHALLLSMSTVWSILSMGLPARITLDITGKKRKSLKIYYSSQNQSGQKTKNHMEQKHRQKSDASYHADWRIQQDHNRKCGFQIKHSILEYKIYSVIKAFLPSNILLFLLMTRSWGPIREMSEDCSDSLFLIMITSVLQ